MAEEIAFMIFASERLLAYLYTEVSALRIIVFRCIAANAMAFMISTSLSFRADFFARKDPIYCTSKPCFMALDVPP